MLSFKDEQNKTEQTKTAATDNFVVEGEGLGSIQISNNVIAAIVKKYVSEVEGVIRFAPQSLVGDIADMLSKRSYDRNIVIELGDGEVKISVKLVLLFGINLVNVAKEVQLAVSTKVEELTNIKVSQINVIVESIEEPAPAPEQDAAAESTISAE